MVFGIFARKSTLDDPDPKTVDPPRLPTPTPSVASVTRHSPLRFSTTLRALLNPGDENDVSPAPPATPSPPPDGPPDTRALHDLILAIPPKTLHAYTLAHLRPPPPPALGPHPEPPRPPSPQTTTKLAAFFSTLAPPPSLHCMRCHKDFYEIENEEKDRACRVAHDDESALVSRIAGGTYETLWGCCGQTASGDGSEGPPDGWCYEGRHTTDVKRARFRADSTIHDDRLTSCLKLNCHGIRDKLASRDSHPSPSPHVGSSSARRSNPSPARSQASMLNPRSARKRPRKSLKEASSSENEADAESAGHNAKAKDKETEGSEDVAMAVDEPKSSPKSKPRTKTRSQPIAQARPRSPSISASLPNVTPAAVARTRALAGKSKSTSRTLLSQSLVHVASDSEASGPTRPRTRSHVREESRTRDASRSRVGSKRAKVEILERTRRTWKPTKSDAQAPSSAEPEAEPDHYPDSEQEERGRGRKKRRVRRD